MPTQRPLTVLVVDRDPEERASICHVVGEEYPVLAAFDACDALQVAHASHPDMIVMRVTMQPTPDETHRLRSLLNDRALFDTPILILGDAAGRVRDAILSLSSGGPGPRRGSVTLRDRREGIGRVRDDLHRIIGVRPTPRPTTTPGHRYGPSRANTSSPRTGHAMPYRPSHPRPLLAAAG